LSDIFGICTPTHKPARQVEGSVDVGKYQLLEACTVLRIELAQTSPRCVELLIKNFPDPSFIPRRIAKY